MISQFNDVAFMTLYTLKDRFSSDLTSSHIKEHAMRETPHTLIILTLSLTLWSCPFKSWTSALACTAAHHAPSKIMLKSYDWRDGEGDLYFNPRGLLRSALPHEGWKRAAHTTARSTPHQWRSRFANLTFNQYGHGFPNGGLNEAGLAVEVLWLEESRAPAADARPYVNELEWIQLMLDTCESVDEVLTQSAAVRVSPLHAHVHYFTCDQTGQCATFELLDGRAVVHTGEALPYQALTNHSYQESLEHIQRLKEPSHGRERGSLARFVTAARATQTPHAHQLSTALQELELVKIKGYTKWQIAYDLAQPSVLFKTSTHPKPRAVSLSALLKLSQRAPKERAGRGCASTLTYPLSRRDEGDISEHFTPPKPRHERAALRRRFKRLKLSAQLADLVSAHGSRCSE